MAIGTRSLHIGPQFGPAMGAIGLSMASVTLDAASGKYCPATPAEWAVVLAIAGITSGGPSAIYLMQEASGNLADSVDSFTLTASGTGLGYQAAVAGWTRKAVTTTAAGTGVFASASASLPDISTTSHMAIAYAKVTTQAVATRDVVSVGAAGTTMRTMSVATSGVLRGACAANVANGAADAGGVVRPWCPQINRTAAAAAACTDAERVTPAISAGATGKGIGVGNVGSSCITASFLYRADFFAAAAEWTAAQMRTVLTVLGWTVLW